MKTYFLELKAVILVLCCLIGQTTLVAQSYSLNPGKTFTAIVDTNQLNYNGIEIINTGTTNLDFTWELLLKDTLIDSEFDLCNSGICFNTLPVNGIMPTILSSEIGFLKLHMFSGKTEGVNTIKYILKNSLLSTADTLTFIITVGNQITSLQSQKALNNKIILYPNPAKDNINLSLELVEMTSVKVCIYNAVGHLVFENSEIKSVVGHNEVNINTSDLASGIYSVLILTNNGVINQKLVVSK